MNEDNHSREEWGGWKIVSDMLDNPDKDGIYPTSECYQKLYEFVVEQKEAARKHERLCFENGMQFVGHLQHRCPQCGEETQTKMSWLESYKVNALWGRCFECVSKDNSASSGN